MSEDDDDVEEDVEEEDDSDEEAITRSSDDDVTTEGGGHPLLCTVLRVLDVTDRCSIVAVELATELVELDDAVSSSPSPFPDKLRSSWLLPSLRSLKSASARNGSTKSSRAASLHRQTKEPPPPLSDIDRTSPVDEA